MRCQRPRELHSFRDCFLEQYYNTKWALATFIFIVCFSDTSIFRKRFSPENPHFGKWKRRRIYTNWESRNWNNAHGNLNVRYFTVEKSTTHESDQMNHTSGKKWASLHTERYIKSVKRIILVERLVSHNGGWNKPRENNKNGACLGVEWSWMARGMNLELRNVQLRIWGQHNRVTLN